MTNPTARETPDLRDECDVRTGVHRGTCALCVGEASPFAEGLLLTHFQHTEDCHANPCSCHFYEDLAVIRVALAATPEPAPAVLDEERLARALDMTEDANMSAGSHVGLDLRMSDLAEAIAAEYAALTATPSEATE